MKSLFPVILFLYCAYLSTASELTPVERFGKNTGNLRMLYFAPPDSISQEQKPLLVVLHGCSQTANIAAQQTGWNKLAEHYGFFVLYPEQKQLNNPSFCFDWFRPDDITRGSGEAASIKEMMEWMQKKFRIDSTKIFVAGLSAGAAMAVVMMADYPSSFNAGAVFAGGPYMSATDAFSAMRSMTGFIVKSSKQWGELVRKQNPAYKGEYPRIIIFHGTKDLIVDPRNSKELIKQWTNLHHTDTIPDERTERFAGDPTLTKYVYKNESGEEPVIFFEAKGIGHSLMIDTGKCRDKGGKEEPFTTVGAFHSTYWTAVEFGLAPRPGIVTKFTYLHDSLMVVCLTIGEKNSVYQWNVPQGCVITDGQGSSSLTVKWKSGLRNGTISVMATDPDGCGYHYEAEVTLPKQNK